MSEHTTQQAPHDRAPGIPPEDVAAVHAYAGAFCGKQRAAADLAAEVLARAAGQQEPVPRTALLADVRRTADGWLRDGRGGQLRPGFRDWAQRAGETFGRTDTLRRVEQSSLLLRAFGELAEQPRAALWLCLAEPAETAVAARVLSTSDEFAEAMAQSARARLADAFLRLRAEHTADARCVQYGSMLGAIARGTHRETPADLRQHLETCRFCAHDVTRLHTLTSGGAEEVRTLLVDGLLVWGGPAYRSARGTGPVRPEGHRPAARDEAADSAGTGRASWAAAARSARTGRAAREGTAPSAGPAPAGAAHSAGLGHAVPPAAAIPDTADAEPRPDGTGGRRPVLAIALAVVLTATATTVAWNLLSDGGQDQEPVGAPAPPSASASVSPSASPAPSATGTALATVALENTGTGQCLTAAAGNSPDNPPVPAACDGGTTQQWRVVSTGKSTFALEHIASTFCLDIAGERVVGDPMQLRPCAHQQGDDAPYPEDQAFLLKSRQDRTFTLVCQDNTGIAVGIGSGEVRMLAADGSGKAIRFALDDALEQALGN